VTGRFIALEGGEGSGKSTQARLLADDLGALATFEPGDTVVGAAIRAVLLDPATSGLDDRAEALLMAADRAQHAREVIRPALESGRHVVCDRYVASSIAYQGYGRGMAPDRIADLSAWATGGLLPDLTVLLDVPVDLATARLSTAPDRFEAAGADFHERVVDGYRTLAAADPAGWAVVDGSGSIEQVASAVRAAVRERLGL
jgi:dTMP kinase